MSGQDDNQKGTATSVTVNLNSPGLTGDDSFIDNMNKDALFAAAEEGDSYKVKEIIDVRQIPINSRTKDGCTALHLSAKNGHLATVTALINRSALINAQDKTGMTALHYAVSNGYSPVVKLLLENGANMYIRTKENYTPLHQAVKKGKWNLIVLFLECGVDLSMKGGKKNEPLLNLLACLEPSPEALHVARMLIISGANINAKSQDGETPLYVAAKTANTELFTLLISEGADAKAVSKNNETILHGAVKNGRHEIIRLVLDHFKSMPPDEYSALLNQRTKASGETALHLAANDKDDEIVLLLIEYGANTDFQTIQSGDTIFHRLVENDRLEALRKVSEKFDFEQPQLHRAVNLRSKDGKTALIKACEKGRVDMTKILLDSQADIGLCDEEGKSCLHWAAENGYSELFELLLSKNSYINVRSKQGLTPLHLAAKNGQIAIVESLIIEYEAAINTLDLQNATPLHLAAHNGQTNMCLTLIKYGANRNALDSKSRTPLHLAVQEDHPDTAKVLLQTDESKEGTLLLTGKSGFSCVQFAAENGCTAVLNEFLSIDSDAVVHSKHKDTGETVLHIAAGKGHVDIVRILLEAGADPTLEDSKGSLALFAAIKCGHLSALRLFDAATYDCFSRKTGFQAIHIAAYYGKMDCFQYLLNRIMSPFLVTEKPTEKFDDLLGEEYAYTCLHLAAFSGHELMVRFLLDISNTDAMAVTAIELLTPLHLAVRMGHLKIIFLLLAKCESLLQCKDAKNRTVLHVAALHGQDQIASMLISRGAAVDALDEENWTPLHLAAWSGHSSVVKLLIDSGSDVRCQTKAGDTPLCLAVVRNHYEVSELLIDQPHDGEALSKDKKFLRGLAVTSSSKDFGLMKQFILASRYPNRTAARLSKYCESKSQKSGKQGVDWMAATLFAQSATRSLTVLAQAEIKDKDGHSSGKGLELVLEAGPTPFIDLLIECEQKSVLSEPMVQQYVDSIWTGGATWSFKKALLFVVMLAICPPAWLFFSLPLKIRIVQSPMIKLMCHLISHTYFVILLLLVCLCTRAHLYEIHSPLPFFNEWLLLLWLVALFTGQCKQIFIRKFPLDYLRLSQSIFGLIAICLHVSAFLATGCIDKECNEESILYRQTLLYTRNEFLAAILLISCIQYLEYLTLHSLFGPLSVIIKHLTFDVMRFLAVLFLFIIAFTLTLLALVQPAHISYTETGNVTVAEHMGLSNTVETLFFAMFGLVESDFTGNLPNYVPYHGPVFFKFLFGIYMIIVMIVLINLLIAMMSDTYRKIQAQSDLEWKYGRSKLIRQMSKNPDLPIPINLLADLWNAVRVIKRKFDKRVPSAPRRREFAFSGNEYERKELLDGAVHPKNFDIETDERAVIDWQRVIQEYKKELLPTYVCT